MFRFHLRGGEVLPALLPLADIRISEDPRAHQEAVSQRLFPTQAPLSWLSQSQPHQPTPCSPCRQRLGIPRAPRRAQSRDLPGGSHQVSPREATPSLLVFPGTGSARGTSLVQNQPSVRSRVRTSHGKGSRNNEGPSGSKHQHGREGRC